jgi:hypothetical protein
MCFKNKVTANPKTVPNTKATRKKSQGKVKDELRLLTGVDLLPTGSPPDAKASKRIQSGRRR